MFPCKKCITLAICKHKEEVDCVYLYDYLSSSAILPIFKRHSVNKYMPNITKAWGPYQKIDLKTLHHYVKLWRE